MVMTKADGRFSTYEIGTTTGLVQSDGSLIVDGAETYELTGTTTTFDVGIGAITRVGTYEGTFSHETIAIDGDPGMVTTKVDGTDSTQVAGTATGEVNPTDGITTVDGAETND
jgi:hypothetical protein